MSGAVYWVLWLFFRLVARLVFRYRVIGADRVPTQGGVLVAANHASYLDIPLLGCGLTRRARFLGRQDLFPIPGMRALCRWLGWIPIRHDRLSREGFQTAIGLLKAGKVVVIYPEGTRTLDGRLRPGKPGIGVLVAETGCRVVPAYLDGTYAALPPGGRMIRPHAVTVTFGTPIDFAEVAGRLSGKEFYRHVSRTVMERIAALGQVSMPSTPGVPERQPAARPFNAE